MIDDVLDLVSKREGHFLFESGHHGQLWLELQALCVRLERVEPFAWLLAEKLSRHRIEAVCGPLVEGAFIAMMVARRLEINFTYAVREADPVTYRVPSVLRSKLARKRVAIVNDVINAGSAAGSTWRDLESFGVKPVAIGSLVVLGSWSSQFAAEKGIALEALASHENPIWTPDICPLCARGIPLEHPEGARS